jgi:glycogen debranching enzyme
MQLLAGDAPRPCRAPPDLLVVVGTDTAARPHRTQPAEGGHDSGAQHDRHRKQQVLARGHASQVRSISDAVVIKNGEPFFLCPPDGQIALDGNHGFGLYHHDTRFLSGYELSLVGVHPNPLAAVAASGQEATLELTTPELHLDDGTTIGKDALGVRLERRLDGHDPELHDTVKIHNYTGSDHRLRLRISLAARFEDVFEIRGLLRLHPGTLHDPAWRDDRLVFAYDGKDRIRRTLTATFDPGPSTRFDRGCEIEIESGARQDAKVEIRLHVGEQVLEGGSPIENRSPQRHPSQSTRKLQLKSSDGLVWAGGGDDWPTAIRSGSILLDSLLARSLDDLSTLRGELDGQHFYAAGIPWFSTLFGRDSIISAFQTLAFDRTTAAETLRLLAGRQGTKDDDWREEEPGKILHELRIGELARLDEIPHTPYYGTVDATPLFLVLLAEHARWEGSLDLFHDLRSNAERALDWVDRSMERHDGYVAYDSTKGIGLVNQGWKDSGNAIVDADGTIAEPPIALPEVQGYVERAWRSIADLFERDGDADRANELRSKADDLRLRFERDFWSDDLGCYALALGKGQRRCEVVASNAGQVLLSGLASREHANRVARRLVAHDVLSGWGIRTMSTTSAAYNPIGYHLGTVWPHDNSLIATGFRRYGLDDDAERLLTGLIEASRDFEHQRLPECFAGFDRGTFSDPVRYPIACHPQAWAAGAIPLMITATLGLEPDGFRRQLRIVRPRLPSFVPWLEVRNLRVGAGSVDLSFRAEPSGTWVDVRRAESVDVSVEPA